MKEKKQVQAVDQSTSCAKEFIWSLSLSGREMLSAIFIHVFFDCSSQLQATKVFLPTGSYTTKCA